MRHVKELLEKYIEADDKILEERDKILTFWEVIDDLQEALKQDEEENRWIPVSERLPDPDEYILVSFENFSVPMIGKYTVDDEDNGTFRIGDEVDSFVDNDLFVNAWMPLPKPYKEETNNV